eukprot:SAG31_NODE_2212_length_6174_cov_11.856790_6_plen_130_part_00
MHANDVQLVIGLTLTEKTLALRPYLPNPGLRPTAACALVDAAISAHGHGAALRLADPMCGHGVLLVEAARHWPAAIGRCIGADISDDALLAAQQNIDAANVAEKIRKGCYFLVFVPTIREIRDFFYREM